MDIGAADKEVAQNLACERCSNGCKCKTQCDCGPTCTCTRCAEDLDLCSTDGSIWHSFAYITLV